jgi:tetratricopeptide (TPR) repeat protein
MTTGAADKAALLYDLALIEADADRWKEAVKLNRQAVRYAARADDPALDELIQAQHALAYGLLAQGQTVEAGRIARACWRQVQRQRPRDLYGVWVIRRLLANHAVAVGRCSDAVRHLREAIPAAESSEGKRSTLVAELRAELAELLMDRKPAEALAALEPAVAVLSRERGPWHEDTRVALRCAARALDSAGQSMESERQYRRLLEHTPRDAADRATLTADLGCLLAGQERHAEALPFLREAFHRFRNDPDFDPEDLDMFATRFADVLCELGLEREMDMMWDLLERPATPRRQKRP